MTDAQLGTLTTIALALIALAKMYLELKYTRAERDSVIRGVEKHGQYASADSHDYLKARIKHEADGSKTTLRLKKAVKKVREDME